MPFRLKNAPATFERGVKSIISKHLLKNFLNYFDDIVVFSNTFPGACKSLASFIGSPEDREY